MPTPAELEQLEREANEQLIEAGYSPEQVSETEVKTGESPAGEGEAEPKGEAKPEAKPEGEPEASAEAAPEQSDTAAEPEAPPELAKQMLVLEARYKNAQGAMTRAQQEAAGLRKENAAQKTRIDSLATRLALLEESARSATAAAETARTTEMQQQIAKLAEDYPDLAPLFQQYNVLAQTVTAQKRELDALKTKPVQTTDTATPEAAPAPDTDADIEAQVAAHIKAIAKAHPDWQAVTSSEAWHQWVAQQPDEVKEVVQTGTADEANKVIAAYKKFDKARKLEAALKTTTPATPSTRQDPSKQKGKPTFSRAEINAMSRDEFIRREAEIDEATREGRIT